MVLHGEVWRDAVRQSKVMRGKLRYGQWDWNGFAWFGSVRFAKVG